MLSGVMPLAALYAGGNHGRRREEGRSRAGAAFYAGGLCLCGGVDLQRQVDGLRRFLIVTEGATSKPHLSKLLSPREADCPFYEDY